MSQLTVFLLVLLQACLVFAKDNTWKVPVGISLGVIGVIIVVILFFATWQLLNKNKK